MTYRLSLLFAVVLSLACAKAAVPDADAGFRCESDEQCDDRVFCNGSESCEAGMCRPGSEPCDGRTCNESTDECGPTTCVDDDGDGELALACGGDDCDDNDPNVNPSATEVCDGADVDEDCDPNTFGFRDQDMDGVADGLCCNGTNCGGDCNDTNANVGTGLPEACDDLDNDCDGSVDEGALTTYYVDGDGDDFGDPLGETRMACSQPDGFAENDDDCNDTTAAVSPGSAEMCDQYADNDCNEATESGFDPDGDGFDTFDAASCPGGLDCDGNNTDVYPGAPELCDGVDSNCDGSEAAVSLCSCDGVCSGLCVGTCGTVDYATGLCAGVCDGGCGGTCSGTCSTAGFDPTVPVVVEDLDGDGELALGATCAGGPFGDLPRTDCNDGDPWMGQGTPEVCDGKDNDCDGFVDNITALHVPVDDIEIDVAPTALSLTLDASCLGSRTVTIGGPTTSDVAVDWFVGSEPGGLEEIQVWTDSSVPSTTCGADCTAVTTGLNQSDFGATTLSVAHNTGAEVALVQRFGDTYYSWATYLLSLVRPPERPIFPVTISADLGVGDAAVYVVLDDCAGQILENYVVRIYREGATPSCAANPLSLWDATGYLANFNDGSFTAEGEMVTLEAVGRVDGQVEVLARERVRMRSETLTTVRLRPLRADSPPVP